MFSITESSNSFLLNNYHFGLIPDQTTAHISDLFSESQRSGVVISLFTWLDEMVAAGKVVLRQLT